MSSGGVINAQGDVVRKPGSLNGDTISLELTGDTSSLGLDYQPPFNPSDHNLSQEFRLTKFGDIRGNGMKPNRDELHSLLAVFTEDQDQTVRETSVTRLDRVGLHLVETNDILCPVLDDPYLMGKIACASVMSGIYSLGIAECATSRMILATSNRMEESERNIVVPMIIRGFRDAAKSVGTDVQSAQMLTNPWCLIGGTATAVCSSHELVPPDGATVGDVIVLTKPLGTMVAVTVAHWMELPERRSRLLLTITEEDVAKAHRRAVDSMTRTNKMAAILMRKYNAHAACDVSAYGVLGHAEMLVKRQSSHVSFVIHNMPVIAKMSGTAKVTGNVMPLLQGLMPEISGGLLVVLPREQAAAYCKALEKTEQRQAWIIGIVESGNRTARVIDRPRVIEVPAKETGASLW